MNKKTYLIIIVSFLCFQMLFSQISRNNFDDSLRLILYSNPEKAIKLSQDFLITSKNNKNKDDIIASYSALGVAYEIKNKIDSTLYYYYKSLNLSEKPEVIMQLKYSIAGIYEREELYDDALDLYNQALTVGKDNDFDEGVNKIKARMALIKVNIGESNEVIKVLKEIYDARKKDEDVDLKFVRKGLIEAYQKKGEFKLSDSLVAEGLAEANTSNNIEFLFYMTELQAKSYYLQKEYYLSKKSIKEAIHLAKQLKNDEFINKANYLKSTVLFNEKDYINSKKIVLDALNNNSIKTDNQLSKYYQLLAKIYKNTDSFNQSNIYLQKHLEQNQIISKKRLSALGRLHDIAINEEVIENKKQKTTKWFWTGVSITLLILIFTLIFFIKSKAKTNQKRFDILMVKINAFEERKIENNKTKLDNKVTKETIINEDPTDLAQAIEKLSISEDKSSSHSESEVESSYVIDDKKVQEILDKIQNLEDKMYFLRQDCTLHNMAKKLKTNTSYLSKIVNTHLDKTFSTYINELRINHAIIELKNNKRMRAYSVKGIAEEMGYKNADAFSRYFRAATGISPSVYIKKIQEI